MKPKKNRAPQGARLQYVGVGADNYSRGNMLIVGDSGRIYIRRSASLEYESPQRAEQWGGGHVSHAKSQTALWAGYQAIVRAIRRRVTAMPERR